MVFLFQSEQAPEEKKEKKKKTEATRRNL